MSISSFEADMINFFDENNNFIRPAIADKFSAGEYLSMLANVIGAKYIWFSHGHPDHINHDSLHLFKKNEILVSEHFGSRIYNDLKSENYNISILKDREWKNLSKNISIMPIVTNTQDSICLDLSCVSIIFYQILKNQ